MKMIIGEPGSGKTKEILALSSINNVPILCESEERVSRLITKAQGYGYKIPTPIVYNQIDDSVKTVGRVAGRWLSSLQRYNAVRVLKEIGKCFPE